MEKHVLTKQEEFNYLFKKLTGYEVYDAKTNEDGWLYVPGRIIFNINNTASKRRLVELAGGNKNWSTILGDDEIPDGFWIKRPDR